MFSWYSSHITRSVKNSVFAPLPHTGVVILIEHLMSSSDDVIAMSADVLSDVASSRRARKQIRTKGGLEILVGLRQIKFDFKHATL